MLPYADPIIYPKYIDRGIQNTVKPNKLLFVMTVCRLGFHNGVMAYMSQFGLIALHRIFVAWLVFVKTIFSCLNLKLMIDFYLTGCLRFLIKLDMASQTL